MNLLDKIWKWLFAIATFAVISCDDPSEIAIGLTPEALYSQVNYEEINLLAKNVFVDSLRTSNSNRLLVGRSVSDIFGTTSSIALCQLSTQAFSPTSLVYETDTVNLSPLEIDTLSSQSYHYDYAYLTLEVNYIHANDTPLGAQEFSIHQLDDEIFQSAYYLSNFDTPYLESDPEDVFEVNFDEDLLGKALEDISDTSSNTYSVDLKLSNSIGEKLFDIIKNPDSQNTLKKDFKGIALVGGEDNTAIIGFKPTGATQLVVHYSILEERADSIYTATDSLQLRFSLANANARYNKIETDRTGSLIGANISDNLVEFDTGDDQVYLQPGSGIYPKISLEPLYDFFSAQSQGETDKLIQINQAIISIRTKNDSTKYISNNSNFRFFFMEDGHQINISGLSTNDLFTTLVNTDEGFFGGYQDELVAPLILTKDTINDENKYSYDAAMTFFVQQVESGLIEADKLILIPTDLNNMDQSVFEIEEMKLLLYYSITN